VTFEINNLTESICVAGDCRNQALPEMPGVSSIAQAFPEKEKQQQLDFIK
jgi:hypothetical protein